jgi:hypothetical protein
MYSVPITTKDASLNPAHGEVYSIQHYVIKFVSDFRWFSPWYYSSSTKKTYHHDIAEILLKVALNIIRQPVIINSTEFFVHDWLIDWLIVFWCYFRQYFSYIMTTSFSGGGSRREPPTMGKQLVNFITCGCESSAPFFSSPGLCELLSSLFVRRLSSVVRPSTFHILIFSSEITGPIATKLWWNGPWMAPFQKCVRWSWLPTKMAAKLKIEKMGDTILIVHCCFSISQNELKF